MSVETGQAITTGSPSVTQPVDVSAGVSPARQANMARLQGLVDELVRRGLRARIMTPPGRVPSLHG